jgi:hypothetical protein
MKASDRSASRWKTFVVLDHSGQPCTTYELDEKGKLQPKLPQKRRRFDLPRRAEMTPASVPGQMYIAKRVLKPIFDQLPDPAIIEGVKISSNSSLDEQAVAIDGVDDNGFFE